MAAATAAAVVQKGVDDVDTQSCLLVKAKP
jgi:hypothetical protein